MNTCRWDTHFPLNLDVAVYYLVSCHEVLHSGVTGAIGYKVLGAISYHPYTSQYRASLADQGDNAFHYFDDLEEGKQFIEEFARNCEFRVLTERELNLL